MDCRPDPVWRPPVDTPFLAALRANNSWLDDPASFPAAVDRRLPGTWIPRRIRGTDDWPVHRKAHLLVGARQAGKSSFLWHRFRGAGTAPLFLDASEPAARAGSASPALALADPELFDIP